MEGFASCLFILEYVYFGEPCVRACLQGTEGVCLPGGGGASPGSFARSLHWPAAVRNSVNLGISAFRARQLLGQGGVPVVSVEGNKSEEEGREEWDGVLDVKCWRSNPGMRGPGETLLTHAERERKGGRRETRQDLASGVEAQRLAEECEALVFGRSRKGRGKGATRKDGKGRIQMEPLAARGVESENRDGSSATQDESHTPSNGTPEPVSVSSLLRFLRNESLPPSLSPFLVKRKQRSPGEAVLPLSPFPPALADLASRLLEDTEGTREGKTTKDHFEKGTAQVFREASQDPSADLEHCPSLPSVAFRVLAVTHAQPSQIPTDNTEGLPNRHSHSDPLLQGVSLEDDRRSRKRGRRKVVSKKETASLLYFERERQDTPPLPSTKHPDGSLPPALYDPPPPPDEKPPMAVLELESLDGSADLKTTEIEATFAACGFPIVRAGELSPRDSTSGPNHSLGMRTLERLRGPSWTQPSENEEYLDLMDLPVEGRNGALQVQLCELEIGDPLHPADRRPRVLLRLGFPALWQNVMEV
uniref:Uncharacterized protein n=1 Tax=Chromera velia CCMP2878 TaxID=1169474 RepID=A0A0G4I3B1_9ALVE|eukprot:Cvel_10609.t1-p1 / transcript=Cvel_10609.t1 / gene=Cvel_10609 / organism=Chromera_velia_CCMP2878 / gene_product=hypothetical protein / transcript_product=hypothetical protein / location=Cvel_scaffold643:72008-74057(+) / protein_length=531 / sequence_SO=supercontig / SO=protein_coding / is_pseudo=false